jgi:thiamine-phosphate pyrophosphorylase
LQIDATKESVAAVRKTVGPNRIVGAYAGHSRHFAMEAAEQGADYVALSQNGPSLGGEPIVKWWAEMAEIPCVAFDPVDASDLDTLLPQNPDFIRPSDLMWESPSEARRIVKELSERLKKP